MHCMVILRLLCIYTYNIVYTVICQSPSCSHFLERFLSLVYSIEPHLGTGRFGIPKMGKSWIIIIDKVSQSGASGGGGSASGGEGPGASGGGGGASGGGAPGASVKQEIAQSDNISIKPFHKPFSVFDLPF